MNDGPPDSLAAVVREKFMQSNPPPSGMRAAVRAAFLPFTQAFEGHCSWMYLDQRGLVTTGYGNLIENVEHGTPAIPAVLDWRDLAGLPVDASAVRAEWDRIKAAQQMRDMGGGAFRSMAQLRATEASIEALVLAELGSDFAVLASYFPDLPSWPADAQLGVLSLAWACGARFPDPACEPPWPHFVAAARAQDWPLAAAESHISTVGNAGVARRNAANQTLFLNAARATDPDVMLYRV